ncbi:hypothetical protein VPNG_09194 [Cytospora leucostoma]|uniref:Uncharacterized protein n=1 Tax=Cytospora leucostoma TaxID=1230097 RepID=A0A423VU41_9PEZI|nr:hypothetical protein VPNG_09194 [Cytospora leucostoma]
MSNRNYLENGNDYSFARLKRSSDFSANDLNIGTAGLEGCTVLTVASSEAVYMGHFFENLAWAPDAEYEIDSDTAFQENCLNLITDNGNTWRAKGDAIDPSLFIDFNPVAFIMTPRQDQDDPTDEVPNPPVPGPKTQQYQAKVEQLVATLQGLIPGLSVIFYNYIAMELEDYETEYQGVALFEYDPNADGHGNANFRIWYEAATEDAWGMGILVDPYNS